MMQASDAILTTFSGGAIDLSAPESDSISIVDIATGLSNTCRFGAQASRFYSVAQHAISVSQRVIEGERPDLALVALHHDSHEAFICDLPTPLKQLLGSGYREIADRLDVAIGKALGFEWPDAESEAWAKIRLADEDALLDEAAILLRDGGAELASSVSRTPVTLTAMGPTLSALTPPEAFEAFMDAHNVATELHDRQD